MTGREIQALIAENQQLRAQLAAAMEQIVKLTAALEEARRAGKRQAAPFRKKHGPKPRPEKPGRKSGDDHGTHAHRQAPQVVDEVLDVPLPEACPHCGCGDLRPDSLEQQFQTEIPRRAIHRRFDIRVGHCTKCGRSVRPRHPLQTSGATGAAASQLGPEAHAAVTVLNKGLGLSHGKVQWAFEQLFGISISRSTSARSTARTAGRCQAAWDQLRRDVRGSPVVVPDETGWRVGGQSAWLHAFAAEQSTCYLIDPTRSGEPAEQVLGLDWSGVLIHDGWSVYDRFTAAVHQQCLAHLLRRCEELLETATRGAVRLPRAIQGLLRAGLELRDRHQAGEVGAHGLRVMAGRLTGRLARVTWAVKRHAGNERLAAFVHKHVGAMFTFLRRPGVPATNWWGEHAIRPAVVNRKVWGGNRTWCGAQTQSILMSVLRTCQQRAVGAIDWLARALTSPIPQLLPASVR